MRCKDFKKKEEREKRSGKKKKEKLKKKKIVEIKKKRKKAISTVFVTFHHPRFLFIRLHMSSQWVQTA